MSFLWGRIVLPNAVRMIKKQNIFNHSYLKHRRTTSTFNRVRCCIQLGESQNKFSKQIDAIATLSYFLQPTKLSSKLFEYKVFSPKLQFVQWNFSTEKHHLWQISGLPSPYASEPSCARLDDLAGERHDPEISPIPNLATTVMHSQSNSTIYSVNSPALLWRIHSLKKATHSSVPRHLSSAFILNAAWKSQFSSSSHIWSSIILCSMTNSDQIWFNCLTNSLQQMKN